MEPRKSFLLRMDPRLWAELESWSQEEMRSVNGQIEYLLKQAVQQRKKRGAAPPPADGPAEDQPETEGPLE